MQILGQGDQMKFDANKYFHYLPNFYRKFANYYICCAAGTFQEAHNSVHTV